MSENLSDIDRRLNILWGIGAFTDSYQIIVKELQPVIVDCLATSKGLSREDAEDVVGDALKGFLVRITEVGPQNIASPKAYIWKAAVSRPSRPLPSRNGWMVSNWTRARPALTSRGTRTGSLCRNFSKAPAQSSTHSGGGGTKTALPGNSRGTGWGRAARPSARPTGPKPAWPVRGFDEGRRRSSGLGRAAGDWGRKRGISLLLR